MERSGALRWMIRRDEMLQWGDSKEELWDRFGLENEQERQEPKSVTFIASSLFDNKILMKANPSYLANLKALTLVERERLLHGNWKIKASAGMYFKRSQVGNILEVIPGDVTRWVRAWDLAATTEEESGDAAYTASVLMGKRKDGRYVIADVTNARLSASDARKTIKLAAQADKARFKRVRVRLPQDPGQAGKAQSQDYIRHLAGFDVKALPESGSKEVRAEPMAAQWQAGNIDVLHAAWNDMYFSQLESFPSSKYKDMVDAGSSAFAELAAPGAQTLGDLGEGLGKDSYWRGP
jgi:predicted phage terminase large subunit-like protein